MTRLHRSVLLDKVLEFFPAQAGRVVVDGTVGAGGHSEALLEVSGPDGRLIGFDKDPEALKIAGKVLERFGERFMLIHSDFKNIPQELKRLNVSGVQGVLLDLGVSSMQLDNPERGFSFKGEGPLDMRMDPSQKLTAEIVVNTYPKDKLLEILWTYGEERFARRIVDRVLAKREKTRIVTTSALAQAISEAVPASYRYGRIHPATRTFQALRIEVNDEIEAIRIFLSEALDLLAPKGRLVILSFHSLEDRAVKTAFREFAKQEKGTILTKKPLQPDENEERENPRARSAKMRVFEKA